MKLLQLGITCANISLHCVHSGLMNSLTKDSIRFTVPRTMRDTIIQRPTKYVIALIFLVH